MNSPLRLWDFNGGVHPPENKAQSTRTPISQPPLPELLILPLKQHAGAAAEPIVNVGERVLKGQLLAEPYGRVSAAIHAPTSGTIIAIAPHAVPHPSGMADLCIHLRPDGEERWTELTPLRDYMHASRDQVLEHLRLHGIAGLGGAGFPTDVKLNTPEHDPIDTLILNGAECEPYISADDMLMRERADEIVRGGEVLAWLLGNPRVLIGIEDNKAEAISAMQEAAGRSLIPMQVVVIPTKYPSGGAKQLTYLLTGREVPSSGRSHEIGVICCNVGTAAAVFRATSLGEPLISRITTLTGQALANPCNVEALLGTPMQHLLQYAGLHSYQLNQLIMGGPMMGFAVEELGTPITKVTNCLIAGTLEEFPPAPPSQACIRCGLCEQACPADLLPQQLYWFARAQEYDKAEQFNLFDCIECGACAYVCPSHIPLVQHYRHAKDAIRLEQVEQQKAEHARIRFEARQARLAREQEEKEAKRKARAAEAAQMQALRQQQSAAPTAPASGTTVAPAASADIKALKTAAAVARTKLKKAEKALAAAQEAGEDISALQAELQGLQQANAEAEQALQQAEQANKAPAATASIDLKALKTAAAVARTKLKKAEKALAAAQEAGEDTSALQAELQSLQQANAEAEQALQQAEQANNAPAATASVDLKALKTAAAVARTKLKKAEKALAAAQEAGEDTRALQAELQSLQQANAEAEQALQQAEQANNAPAATASVDLKALKTAAAVARTKLKKAEKALAAAQEAGEDTSALQAELQSLQQANAEAEQALQQAEQANHAPLTATAVAASPDLKTLKIEAATARTKVKKAQQALQLAQDKGLETATLSQTLAELQSKAEAAEQALAEAEAQANPQHKADPQTLKQLKITLALANAHLKKTERQHAQAQAAGDETEAISQELEQARQQVALAQQALTAAEG
ncbi:electron transport complex subunit RsxC [Balneatrix alpica]|uniref:electron transport complex subunit RsxC n=2 Tax=Balneatrix alpica TaxID=75684 RepID=UPI00273FB3EE|nr:electron transport complex subunit RsxC [Balneatrix alpica]